MKQLYDKVSVDCSKLTTRSYSTSFSLGIYFLASGLRAPIYSVYGFVRFADEIVDSFHDYDKAELLQEFKEDTWKAIKRKISVNPILNSFQEVVNKYSIEKELIDTFFQSMETDLKESVHSPESYDQYILGSAEVVGLMCLRVFTNTDDALYQKLKHPAMKLGAAFQKVNFLRDLQADYEVLGRTYFPGVNFNDFSAHEKDNIQREIEADFMEGLAGIRNLPESSRRGVYMAYFYYRKLFLMIKKTPPETVLNARIRIPNHKKVGLMFQSILRHQLGFL